MHHLHTCLKRFLQHKATINSISDFLWPCRCYMGFDSVSSPETTAPLGNPSVSITSRDESLVPQEIDVHWAEVIWDYMCLHHTLEKCDVILILGNNDIRVAAHAASLWLQGYADWILFSGHSGNLTIGKWSKTEAEVFSDVAVSLGVPPEKILLEDKATNTGENVRFSYDLLRRKNLIPRKILLVQTPYMERRSMATFLKQWPGEISAKDVLVTSPDIPLQLYPNESVGCLRLIIAVMLGCLSRIKYYPEKGFQIPQEIPTEVSQAYEFLVSTNKFNDFIL